MGVSRAHPPGQGQGPGPQSRGDSRGVGLDQGWRCGACGDTVAAFSYSAHYYGGSPGNTPANHPPTEACTILSTQHRGCRIQDPGTRGYRRWKTADVSHSARRAPQASLRWLGHGGGGGKT